ncbi:MAG: hypothetical protein OEY50_02285 [Nitrospinota bacterium]|nr:hypothetical protein [Nitrospinota bacterium]
MISFKNVQTEWLGPVSFDAEKGGLIKVVAPSKEAAGEFFQVAAGLLAPHMGEVRILGEDIYAVTEEEYICLMSKVGLVMESGGLISNLLTCENVALPALFHRKKSLEQLETFTAQTLQALGLDADQGREIMATAPNELRPFQGKVVRMIRAMAMEPELMIYEEIAGGLRDGDRANVIQLAMTFHRRSEDRISMFVTYDESTLKSISASSHIALEAVDRGTGV